MKLTKDEHEFFQCMKNLSPELQNATLWLMKNIDYIHFLVKDEILPPLKMKEFLTKARKENNYEFLALLRYKEAVDSENYKALNSDSLNDQD